MATKEQIVDALRAFVQRVDKLTAGLSPDDWQKSVYEGGWTVKQAFCHLAAMSNAVPFIINLAAAPAPPPQRKGGDGGTSTAFDADAWNAREVGTRENKPVEEILAEVRTGHDNSIKAVQATSDELLTKEFRAPWGLIAPLGDALLETVNGHNGGHLTDVEQALK